VSAARFADIGIIPYMGPNLNHEFCCPNKLSQYMQAGLAILANRLTFVREVIERYQCGMVYDAREAETLVQAVRHLAEHRDILGAMKRRARERAVKEINWSVQSADYRMAIERMFRAGERNSLSDAGSRVPAEQL
jgi:glycosyltransferase involved in cell wall biosynthesis